MRNLRVAWLALTASSAVGWMACSSVAVPTGPGYGPSATSSSGSADPASTDDGTSGGSSGTSGTSGGSSGTSGASSGDAGADAVSNVDASIYNTPVQCTSATHWTGGETKSNNMMPGSACRLCHVPGGKAGSKSWDVSGTVYATAHEPDDCNGSSASGVTVVITDVNGAVTTLPVNAVGNFWHNDLVGFAAIPKPYKAKVVSGGKTREMITAQTDGDCNKCHTESGTSPTPGRIMLP